MKTSDPEKKREADNRYNEKNRLARAEYRRSYYKANPAKDKQNATQRLKGYQEQYKALDPLTQKVLDHIYCKASRLNQEHGANSFHVDHIHPRKLGGWHHPDNLRIVTREENLRKGAKLDFEKVDKK